MHWNNEWNITVSGNAALSGNVAIDNDLDVGDRVTASEVRVDGHLDVMGPASMEYLDVGQANISDLNVIQANISDLDVGDRVTAFEVRVDGHLDVMGGATMEDLNVIGYSANFENAQEVRVPTPDQPNEAANKAYVDSAIATENTKELVQLAVTENLPDISEYYLTYESSDGAANPEQGDLVLLAGQTVASENGIYEVSSVNLSSSYASNSEGGPSASDYYVTLIRSTNFDSADEFITGSFVFIEKGSSLGEGYVLGELASNFALGTSPVSYVKFTIDTTSDVEFNKNVSANSLTTSGTLTVSGNAALSGSVAIDNDLDVGQANISDLNVIQANISDLDVGDRVTAFEVRVDGHLDVMGGATMEDLNVIGYSANFENAQEVRVPTPDQPNEAANKAYVDSAIATVQSDVDQNELDADAAIAAEAVARDSAITAAIAIVQSDVDQNELDADAAIASLQAAEAARPSQTPVLLAMEWNQINLNNVYFQYWDGSQWSYAEIGDRILMAGQNSASENGIYEVTSVSGHYASLVRAEDYDSEEEINPGDFIFVQAGELAGQGYVLGSLSESFELGVDALNFSRFTIDTTQDVEFEQRVTAQELRINNGGIVDFNGYSNYISGDLTVDGYRADFEYVQEMRVPTPDQPNEATNKAYVDQRDAINADNITLNNDRIQILENSSPQWTANADNITLNNDRIQILENSSPQWTANADNITLNNDRIQILENSSPQWTANADNITLNNDRIQILENSSPQWTANADN